MYSVKILLDSINATNNRITTWQLSYPRFILAELNTHRKFSRSSASSRAIPAKKLRSMILSDPAMPVFWGKNQPGMKSEEEFQGEEKEKVIQWWLKCCQDALKNHEIGESLNIHKQILNRVVEPYAWATTILTSTEFENFFILRAHKDAQPEFAHLAMQMKEMFEKSVPVLRQHHIPMILDEEQDLDLILRKKIATARCARVSYLTHDGRRDYNEDLRLHDQLLISRHLSPFEHVAETNENGYFNEKFTGNFDGWAQYRKFVE